MSSGWKGNNRLIGWLAAIVAGPRSNMAMADMSSPNENTDERLPRTAHSSGTLPQGAQPGEAPPRGAQPQEAPARQAAGAAGIAVPQPNLRLAETKRGYAEGSTPPDPSKSQTPNAAGPTAPDAGRPAPPVAGGPQAPKAPMPTVSFASAARTETALLADLFSFCRTQLSAGEQGAFFRAMDGDRLAPTESFGFGTGDLAGAEAKRGVGLVGVAALSGRPQLRVDLGAELGESETMRALYAAKRLRSALAVPFALGNSVLGVIVLYSTDAGAFTLSDAGVVQRACSIAAPVLLNMRTLGEMEQEVQEARLLIDMAHHLGPSASLEELMTFVIDRAKEMVGGDVASVMLSDPSTSELWIGRADGLSADVVETTKLAPGCGIAGWVAENGRPLILRDFPFDGSNGKVKWAACVPMHDGDKVVGVLNVGSRDRDKTVADQEMNMLLKLARQAGSSVESARALAAMRELHFQTMRALIGALEAVDPYGKGHSENVARYAGDTARRMGLSAEQIKRIETAGMLHDVGKATLGEGLLRKSRPLTTVEQAAVHLHPEIAVDLLKDVPMLSEIVPAIAHHHERFDGGGYGRGLKGEDIPLSARILAVADAFDAMTSERPYRAARSVVEAAAELDRGAGKQFDPRVVAAFQDILRDESWGRDQPEDRLIH